MDLRYTAAELAFRDELRAFFRDNLPGDIRERMRLGHAPSKDEIVRWQQILNRRGWAAYSWPKEYGGPGWTPVERMIFLEENQLAPAPEVSSFNITMIGPVLIRFGTENQKRRVLPRGDSHAVVPRQRPGGLGGGRHRRELLGGRRHRRQKQARQTAN